MFSMPDHPTSRWYTCHAGLHYQKTNIVEDGETIAYLMSGQGFLSASERQRVEQNAAALAAMYGLEENDITESLAEIPIFKPVQRAELDLRAEQFVRAIDSMLHERARLADRLNRIAAVLKEA
jgi:ligand-binding sensor protein